MMKKNSVLLPLLALVLVGCSSSDGGSNTGRLSVSVTDAPVDSAARVVVQFTGVSVQNADGEWEQFDLADSPRQVDLLQMQGTNSEELLDGVEVAVGSYQSIRLDVDAERATLDSFIELEDGAQFSLFVPSGAQSGLKLNRGFIVTAGENHDFVIDFDLRKSVVNPRGFEDYILKPVLRLVDNASGASMEGRVATTLLNEAECALDSAIAVYVYEGADATADDVGSDNEPLTTARVNLDEATGEMTYEFGFLEAGECTLALTCQADQDDPENDDDLNFVASMTAGLEEGQELSLNFE